MNGALRSENSGLSGILSVFLCLLFFASPLCFAEPASGAELEGILQKIESRHYRWIAIRSDILLFFAGAGNKQAMCGGELLYQRLDERMLLVCADTQGELVFAFRTFDRRFDLYLPSQKTVYHGSIFDLEGSPDIESHLKARDLYRALKPLAVDPRRAKIERANSLGTSLDVYASKDGKEALARKLYLTPEGDVRGEIFYDAAGRSATEIQRYDFKEFKGRAGIYNSIIFPKKITIIAPETQKGTALFFSKVKALDAIDPLEFLLKVPYGTKEVFLDQKNLRPQPSKAPASVQKAVPVYLAKPLRKTSTKKVRSSEPNEKAAAKPKEPVNIPIATVRENKTPAEADIVAETPPPAEQTPASYDPSTLDPFVEPTA